jgi:hypothetical protein
MKDDKYVVFKLSEWQRYMAAVGDGAARRGLRDLEALDDAVVIRTQDVFSASGLTAYAQCILAHMDALMLNDDAFKLSEYEERRRQQLQRIADYIYTRIAEAEGIRQSGRSKVPD